MPLVPGRLEGLLSTAAVLRPRSSVDDDVRLRLPGMGLLEGVPALGLLTALLVSRGPGLVDPAVGEPTWTPAGASVVEEAMIPPAAAVVAALVASSPWPSPEALSRL